MNRLEKTLENFKGKKAPPFKKEAAGEVEDGMQVQAHGVFAKGLKDGETYTLKNSGGNTFYFVNKHGIKAHRNDATTIARWLRGGEAGDNNGLTFADKEENIANFKGKKAPPFKKEGSSRLERLVTEAEASKEDYETLLKEVKGGRAILTAQDIHKDVPTIHNFAGKYHSSVEHMGYGMFKGETEHGSFDFDGGGAMRHAGAISWTPLNAEAPVLKDLKYDLKKVEKALQELVNKE